MKNIKKLAFEANPLAYVIGRGIKGYQDSVIIEAHKGIIRFTYTDRDGQLKLMVRDFSEINLETIEDRE